MRPRPGLAAALLAAASFGSALRAAETAPSPAAAPPSPVASPNASAQGATAPQPAAEALALVVRGLPEMAGPDRAAAAAKAAGLALLLGRYSDAAGYYETAAAASAGGGAALLLRAARCRIASGELDRAEDLAALVLMKAADDPASRESSALARLVGAWVLAAKERDADAAALAQGVIDDGVAAGAGGGAARLEARFLAWLCSPAQGKASALAALVSEYPGSPEALIAQGRAAYVPSPHWYLGLIPGEDGKVAAAGASTAASPAASPPPERAKAQGDAPVRRPRLQVGYFSREENATRLRAELRGKGFEAEIEKTLRTGTTESRWIVVVPGGDDAAKVQERLKDAGYESYTLD